MNSLGPFPMRAVLVAGAGLLAWWLVRVLARRMGGAVDASVPKLAAALFTDAFFVGLLAALAFTWWRTRRQTRLRRPVFAGLVAGLLAWFALTGTLSLPSRRLSDNCPRR